jgi:hypothetical protein
MYTVTHIGNKYVRLVDYNNEPALAPKSRFPSNLAVGDKVVERFVIVGSTTKVEPVAS